AARARVGCRDTGARSRHRPGAGIGDLRDLPRGVGARRRADGNHEATGVTHERSGTAMNVYYLPARQTETPELPLTASRWSVLRARAYRAWWRVRLTATELLAVVRRNGQRHPLDEHIWFADEPAPAPRRRSCGPARVIDFDAARRRRAL